MGRTITCTHGGHTTCTHGGLHNINLRVLSKCYNISHLGYIGSTGVAGLPVASFLSRTS
ncbi:hypothetical protein BDR06DRAFT_962322 [Suillus hirtellus]|nr:hypothetical protein BDR06DRAFT_965523 [Suillus hirtellus]KAG2046061.1 hypothetical protein BDR06DRAFT_965441 [Suillus hirtellus]KAG2046168.1 hypothetical protein BDR06DRAFT_965362 [Suillus hirtellus]KAG2048734.1 hypothetical protein BDR06DRAFT_962322 [Suillus hirtellus]